MTSTQTHTPGPWTDDDTREYHPERVIRRNGRVIAKVVDIRGSQFNGMDPRPEITDANAKLIAAAPAMLEALYLVQDFLARSPWSDDMRSQVELQTQKAVNAAIEAAT